MSDNNDFCDKFQLAASCQGHVSYVLFSIHAVNPELFTNILEFNPGGILFWNMLYGCNFYIYSRPAMRRLRPYHRVLFSISGSYMFCHSSLLLYFWLYYNWGDRKILVSILGFFTGRFLYSIFYSYLYFVDICANTQRARNSILDLMFED